MTQVKNAGVTTKGEFAVLGCVGLLNSCATVLRVGIWLYGASGGFIRLLHYCTL